MPRSSATADMSPGVRSVDTAKNIFADSHVHLLGLARALTEPDLGPGACPTIADVLALASAHASPRSSGWVVLRGFDHALVHEPRLLRRRELDAICHHPLRIRHRTGHASLLNSAAFERLPSPPPAARVEPDDEGWPVLLVEAEHWLNTCTGPIERGTLVAALRQADRVLASANIGRAWDTTPRSADQIEAFRALLREAAFSREVRTMRSADEVHRGVRVEGETVKLFPADHGFDLTAVVAAAHGCGASVAIHATTEAEIEVALHALGQSRASAGRDRIEHATLVAPAQAKRIAAVGAVVVTHPGWLASRREKYRRELTSAELSRLLPLRTLHECGVDLVFGSDAPIETPDPALWIRLATDRDDGEAIPAAVACRAACGGVLWKEESAA